MYLWGKNSLEFTSSFCAVQQEFDVIIPLIEDFWEMQTGFVNSSIEISLVR